MKNRKLYDSCDIIFRQLYRNINFVFLHYYTLCGTTRYNGF